MSDIRCPKCDERAGVAVTNTILTCSPPMYGVNCTNCGHHWSVFCHDLHKLQTDVDWSREVEL